MKLRRFFLTIACVLPLSAPASAQHRDSGQGGHWSSGDAWREHGGWHGDIRHFDHDRWRGGHWWRGDYGGRPGWWWIVGPDWYWYSAPIEPYPDPYTPPGATPGFWYWCDAYSQYYPYVGACPTGWRAVATQ